MTLPHRSPRHLTILLAALAVASAALAGCGDAAAHSPAAPGTPVPGPGTSEPPPDEVVFDLARRTVEIAAGRWSVEFCEGDGPFVCVVDAGRPAGVIEHGRWALDAGGVAAEVLAGGGTQADALSAHAEHFVASFRSDRAEGCGLDHRVVADPPAVVSVAGREGLRFGFRGVVGDRTAELVIVHAAIDDDDLVTFTAAAYEPDGCLAPEGEFRVDDLAAFAPTLSRLVAAAQLVDTGPEPEPDLAEPEVAEPDGDEPDGADGPPVADGRHLAWLRSIDGDHLALELVEVLSGEAARAAARADGLLAPGEDLDNDVYVRTLAGDPRNQVLHLIAVAPGATVELLDCARGCRSVGVPLRSFLDGTAQPYGGPRPLVAVELHEGRITHLAEQYLP